MKKPQIKIKEMCPGGSFPLAPPVFTYKIIKLDPYFTPYAKISSKLPKYKN